MEEMDLYSILEGESLSKTGGTEKGLAGYLDFFYSLEMW